MKRLVFNILTGFLSAIILLLSIVFLVIEGRLLFSGDRLVYDNVALGFIKYFFRFLIALFAGTYAVFEFINMKKKSNIINWFLFIGNVSLVIISAVLSFTATNMVGEIALIVALLAFIVRVCSFIFLKQPDKEPQEKNPTLIANR